VGKSEERRKSVREEEEDGRVSTGKGEGVLQGEDTNGRKAHLSWTDRACGGSKK